MNTGWSLRLLVLMGTVLASASATPDIIISSEGLREGKVIGCGATSCKIDNVTVPRSKIFWIGLADAKLEQLPTPQDPTRDEVHYRDGSIHAGRLLAIDANRVLTQPAPHQRARVGWVFLTPATQPATTVQSTSASLGQRGALWTGKIESTWVATPKEGTLRIETVYDPVRLREHRNPLSIPQGGRLVRAGDAITLISEGTVVTERMTFSGVCSYGGSGSATFSGNRGSGGSVIWKKTVDLDTTPGIGWNVPAGLGVYQVSLATPTGENYAIEGCNQSSEGSFMPVVLGRYPGALGQLANDPRMRVLGPGGAQMRGTYTVPHAGGQLTVSWNLCREGGGCASR